MPPSFPMNDLSDYLKTFGINGSVLAAVTLDSIETALSILLLVVTISWTIWKWVRDSKKKDD